MQIGRDRRQVEALLAGKVRDSEPAAEVEKSHGAGRMLGEPKASSKDCRWASQIDSPFRF
jgi:hypothetical protein